MIARRKSYTKIALTLSICLLVLWGILGTTTSLAWFTDTTPTQKNIFNIGELDLVVSYRMENGEYDEIEADTKIFDEEALYEPGYVQVVYLKVENKGDIPFNYRTALMVNNYTLATNKFGQSFNLQDYLRFGVVSAETQEKLEALVETRVLAKDQAQLELSSIADMPLGKYNTEVDSLVVGEDHFLALIVRMPEEVGNVANYRGEAIPTVELGLIVTASQQGTPIK